MDCTSVLLSGEKALRLLPLIREVSALNHLLPGVFAYVNFLCNLFKYEEGKEAAVVKERAAI